MATIKFRSARALVEFVTTAGAVPFATSFDLPVSNTQTANAQPGPAARGNIVLGVEKHAPSNQFVLYHGFAAAPVGADPVLVRVEIKLRVGTKINTDTVIFPIRGANVLQITDPSFQTAQFLIYIEETTDAGGAHVRELFSVGLGGPQGSPSCAGCAAPASVSDRTLCALIGCYAS
jgi:hypothetical protein